MFVALAAVTLLAGSASPASFDGTALDRIERAYADGRIDAPTRALLGLTLARSPASLPEEFRPAAGEAAPRCGAMLVRRAWLENEVGSFDEAQSAQFALGVARPNLDSSVAVLDSAGTTVIATVHYASASTTLSQAQAAADFVTESWIAQVDQREWRVPPEDAGAGGADPDVDLDIYLDPAQSAAVTVPEGTGPEAWEDVPTFVVIDPTVANIQTFIAHELNHVLQYGYDAREADMIYEATAVWMEDEIYDTVNDYTFYVGDFQAAPERALSYATYEGNYMYGAALFVHYLASFGGDGHLIEPLWDGMKQTGATNTVDFYDSVEAQMATLGGFSDLETVYADFAGIRYAYGVLGTFDEGADIDPVEVLATFPLDALENGTSANPPMGLGANYLVVTTTGAAPDDTVTLTVDGNDDGPWAITIVTDDGSGVIASDEDGDGTVEATANGLDQTTFVAFAITHGGGVDAGPDLSTGAGGHTIDLTTHGFSYRFVKEKEPAGCGCRIPAGSRPMGGASVGACFAVAAGVFAVRRRQSPV